MGAALRPATAMGALFGALAVYVAMVGLLIMLHARWVIVEHLSMAQALMLAGGLAAGHLAARRQAGAAAAVASMVSGLVASAGLAGLAALMQSIDLRWMFITLSQPLFDLITLGGGLRCGVPLVLGIGVALGAAGALLRHIPRSWRQPLATAIAAITVAGVFQELIQVVLQNQPWADGVRETLYRWDGLTGQGAAVVFAIAAATARGLDAARVAWRARHLHGTSDAQAPRRSLVVCVVALLAAAFPLLAGSYIGQVMMIVALYALMGMGLNLEFGLAGLLDLGFVAFFALGAYTTALLSAASPLALASFTFWIAMPVAVLASVAVGLLFGLPVLAMRGDYLAVATLGLGEIVRVIVTSDAASPLLGGAQGVLHVPRPAVAGHELDSPVELFYLALAATVLAAYVAWRLQGSRLGRAWRAMRDDEDVAHALGVDLVQAKLLAYGLGAGFAGLAGSIFATMVTAIYPTSFQLVVSINVLALIVVGGTGSLPGVVLGAAVLVGLPELLREFGEYRYLFYGAALVVTMRLRPAGLWPSETIPRAASAHRASEPAP